jgi:hypothetical protein
MHLQKHPGDVLFALRDGFQSTRQKSPRIRWHCAPIGWRGAQLFNVANRLKLGLGAVKTGRRGGFTASLAAQAAKLGAVAGAVLLSRHGGVPFQWSESGRALAASSSSFGYVSLHSS